MRPRGTWDSRRYKDYEIDNVAVSRLLCGDVPSRTNNIDRAMALDHADVNGRSARDVALMVGCSMRTVQRRRKTRRERTTNMISDKE